MTNDHRSDPALVTLVEQARAIAERSGEFENVGPIESSPLSPEARVIVAAWVADGSFDRALAEIAAADPELASQ